MLDDLGDGRIDQVVLATGDASTFVGLDHVFQVGVDVVGVAVEDGERQASGVIALRAETLVGIAFAVATLAAATGKDLVGTLAEAVVVRLDLHRRGPFWFRFEPAALAVRWQHHATAFGPCNPGG